MDMERQLERLKEEYNRCYRHHTAIEDEEIATKSFVPIGYICQELYIDPFIWRNNINITGIEQLLTKIDKAFKFNESQHKFLKYVSEDMDKNLMTLLNMLYIKKEYGILYKCIIMKMISFIYHKWEIYEDDEQKKQEEEDHNLKFVRGICDIIKVSSSTVTEIDLMVKQRLTIDIKFENFFIPKIHR